MKYLPLHFDLAGKRVLVVGGGETARRKVELLQAAGSVIRLVTPDIHPATASLLSIEGIQAVKAEQHKSQELQGEGFHGSSHELLAEPYHENHLRGCVLVVAATDDPQVNQQVSDHCRQRGLPVNVVDAPELCTVIFPAIVNRDPLLVSVGSSGSSPVLARKVREQLEAMLPASLGRLGSYLAQRRDQLKAVFADLEVRRRHTEEFLDSPGASFAAAGQDEKADHWLFHLGDGAIKLGPSKPETKTGDWQSLDLTQGDASVAKGLLNKKKPIKGGRHSQELTQGDSSDSLSKKKAIEGGWHNQELIQGEVYIVGAGPGDPDLLTLKALQLMQKADVILHDHLVSSAVLDRARRDATRELVGKRSGYKSTKQEDINDMLVRLAREGKRVLRLKGGDPFIFGRGGEEISELIEAEIPFQVVPGITAATGCAAYAGIPLTHRDLSQCVKFVTGHPKDGQVNLPWQDYARAHETVVFYMGLGGLATICRQLVQHGRDASTPVAIVSRGTMPDQQLLKGTLETIAGLAVRTRMQTPTLIIVGEVVSFGGL